MHKSGGDFDFSGQDDRWVEGEKLGNVEKMPTKKDSSNKINGNGVSRKIIKNPLGSNK